VCAPDRAVERRCVSVVLRAIIPASMQGATAIVGDPCSSGFPNRGPRFHIRPPESQIITGDLY